MSGETHTEPLFHLCEFMNIVPTNDDEDDARAEEDYWKPKDIGELEGNINCKDS